jgi:hypothetical protein
MHELPSSAKGGVAVPVIKRREASFERSGRGGQTGEILHGAELTTPSAPFKGGFAISLWMSRPPLLCEEGNTAKLISLKIANSFVDVGVDRVIRLGKVPRIEKGLPHVLGIVISNCVGENRYQVINSEPGRFHQDRIV